MKERYLAKKITYSYKTHTSVGSQRKTIYMIVRLSDGKEFIKYSHQFQSWKKSKIKNGDIVEVEK